MRSDVSRREFIAGLGLLAAARSNLSATPLPASASSKIPRLGKSPFKIAVINDEISQDFGHACKIASQKFGMEWMELRSMWNKNAAIFEHDHVVGDLHHDRHVVLDQQDRGSVLGLDGLEEGSEVRRTRVG